MQKITILKYIVFIVLFFSCNSNKKEALKIAVASNLRFTMEDINKEFEKQTGTKVEMITASSGKLTAQIVNGAPYDLFISANKKYAYRVHKECYIAEKPEVLCKGVLVLWSNSKIEVNIETFYKNTDLKTVALANHRNAPYGIAAVEVLKKANIYDTLFPKIVFAESVMQLNQYMINKVAQVGFTSKSVVVSKKLKNIGKWKEIDKEMYSSIKQFVVLLSNESKSAKEYKKFLFSKKSKEILINYGYEL